MKARYALVLTAFFAGWATLSFSAEPKVFTTDADFDLGVLFNVNHDAPNNDQLQLNDAGSIQTFPIMWIANAGEDTISKIDTNTGRELARYRSWFGPAGQTGHFNHLGNPWGGAAPSRSAVDSDGNCYVANREFRGGVFRATLMKILNTGRVDRNGNSTTETSTDADNNGVIGAGEILNFADTNNNSAVEDSEITDERIAWIVTVGPNQAAALARSVSIAPNGNIWVGFYSTQQYFEYSSVDGSYISGPHSTSGQGTHTPYGSLVDSSNILWSASLSNSLGRLDTTDGSFTRLAHSGSNYGIAIGTDPISGGGRVYLGSAASPYLQYHDPTGVFSDPSGSAASCLSLSVDAANDICVGDAVGGFGSQGVSKYSPGRTGGPASGDLIWSNFQAGGGSDHRGTIIDSNQDIWTVNRPEGTISKYRGSDGVGLGVFPVGDQPYTYSDATGSGFLQSNPSGTWEVVCDTGPRGAKDCIVSWTAQTPNGSSIEVSIDASDTNSTVGDFDPNSATPATNGSVVAGVEGRFVYIRAKLNSANQTSPILEDLTLACCPQNGDVNDDCCVDRTDLAIVMAHVRSGDPFDPDLDINGDGVVNILDARRIVVLFCNPLGDPCS